MAKKLANGFLWFCAATMVAQMCILALSFIRGNLNRDTVVDIVARLNGIDIQGERLQRAVGQTKNVSFPGYDEIVKKRAESKVEIDNRESALQRRTAQLDEREARLANEEKAFDNRRKEFDNFLAATKAKSDDQALQEVRRAIENMTVEQAKGEVVDWWKDGRKKEVVAIIQGMEDNLRKKIQAEFSSETDRKILHEITVEIARQNSVNNAIEKARDPNPSSDT